MKGVRIVRYLNQSRTWHITAYSWEEMSIASCNDLIVEWIALSAVRCWKVPLVDQLCRFYSDSPYRNEPTCWSQGVLSLCHCAFSLLSSQRTRTHLQHFKSAKIYCYLRFDFNRREKNYWLTLTVHPEDGSSRFVRSYHYQPTALHDVTSPPKNTSWKLWFCFPLPKNYQVISSQRVN